MHLKQISTLKCYNNAPSSKVFGWDSSHKFHWLKPPIMHLQKIDLSVDYPNNLGASSHFISLIRAWGFRYFLNPLDQSCFPCVVFEITLLYLHLTSPLAMFHSLPGIATISGQSRYLILETRVKMNHDAT